MKAERKTKAQLAKELDKLQRRINKLEAGETKVKNAVSALKESESRFRNIFESSKDGIIFFDGKTRKIILGNKAMTKLLGCSKKELVGRSIKSLHPSKELPGIEKEFQKHVNGNISISPGIPVLRKDGSVFYADISSSPITLDKRTYFSAFFRDTTERKQAEMALMESREQYRSLASAEDSMYLVDKKSRFLFMNDSHLSRLGLSLDKVIGKYYGDFHSLEDTHRFKTSVEKTFRTNRSCQVEHFSERDHKYFLRTFSPVRDAQGSMTAITVISKDITERKRAEDALLESEARYRSLFENSDDAILLTALDGSIFQANASACRMFGRTEAEIILVGRKGLVDETDPRLPAILEERKRTGRVRGELMWKRRDGQLFPGEATSVVFRSKDGLRTCMIIHDITERNQAEEALKAKEEEYRLVVENAAESISITQDGSLKYVNPGGVKILGYPPEMLASKPFIEFIHPDDREMVMDRNIKRMRGEEVPSVYPFRVIRRDGVVRWVEAKAVVVPWKGKPATLNFLYDITERKRAEEALRESEARLRAQYQGSPIPTFTWQKKGETFELVDFNPAAQVTTQGEAKKYLGKTAAEMYQDRQEILQDIYRCFIEKKVIRKELQSQHFLPGRTMITTYAFVPPNLVMVHTEDITDRKRAEEALKENEEKYRNLVERANDGIGIGQDGIMQYANARLAGIVGYSIEEIVGKPFTDFFMPDEVPKVLDYYKRRMDGEDLSTIYETVLRHKDGRKIDIEVNTGIIMYNGKPADLVLSRDITERKRGEEALLESEEKFRNIFDNSSIGKSIISIDGSIEVNQALSEMLGYTKEELSGHKWQEFTHPDDVELIQEHLEQLLSGEKTSVRFIKRYIKKDGSTLWGDVNDVLQKDKDGKPLYYISGILDITERKRLEEILEKERQDLKLILDTTPIIVFYKDKEGRFLRVNKTFAEALNMPESNFAGKTVFDLYSPKIAQGMTDDDQEVIQSQRPKLKIVEQYESASGTRWVRTDKIPICDTNGLPVGLVGFAEDITERKQAEKALFQAEEKYRAIVENAVEGIFQSTSDGKFIMANSAVAKFFGYDSPEELIAAISNIAEQLYAHPEERQRYRRVLADEGVVKGFESQFYRKDGTINWGSMNVRSVRDNEGRILYYEGTIEDITARKEAEEGLQKSLEKLRKALGGIIQAMSLTVETRDPYTAGHQRRVADLARAIAQEMGLPEDQVDALRMAGTVHDLGKISIPAEILSKPVQLSDIEFNLIKGHPQISYDILKDIDFDWPVAQIVLQHHERINGSGYPNGLSGKAIYLEARILAVADVVEAISSHRPYRPAYGIDVALEEIEKNKDVLYDPKVVEACVKLFKEKDFKLE